ncbi:MAG: GNAT family N-acetyltransferase [Desulfosarcina sp.]|nr:GNAT family N-acetyltransferase [Desulfosarcina sp.]MBC2766978.1 GNAT family N-acetyltransferase [Desulfosarcina sp.]
MESVEILEADLKRKDHQKAVVELIDAYAMDPMGNGGPLPVEVKTALIPGLMTFAARPLVNVHDLAVLPAHRGNGAGRLLLAGVEQKARELGCCKVTLEVLENNRRARTIYEAAGFSQAHYQAEAGGALLYAKPL